MNILSLFTGVGGFDLGLRRAGFSIAAQVEIDPFCQKVLEKHWPEVERFGDIRGIDDFPRADVICAGFPCQDISVAGKGAGLSGARSGLWTEALRAIRMVRPKYAILENVAALRNRGLCTILGALAESGYDSEWDCLPASAFGAPHQRDRLFVVAYPMLRQIRQQRRGCSWPDGQGSPEPGDNGTKESLANSQEFRLDGSLHARRGRAGSQNGGEALSHSMQQGLEIGQEETILSGLRPVERSDWWDVEPGVGRVAHGISGRVHRIRALGNAIVPQIPEWIGQQIIAFEEA